MLEVVLISSKVTISTSLVSGCYNFLWREWGFYELLFFGGFVCSSEAK